jgi:ATP-dependent Lhr-like helicase
MLEQLRGERRAVAMRIGGEERWIAAEDAGMYRDAFGAVPPGGLPEVFLERVEDPFARIVRRFARTHGPFTTAEVQRRYGVDPSAVLRELERAGDLVRGELRPGGSEREWCDPEVLRRLRRASLASLRKEVEPAEQRALARLMPSWQGVDTSPPGGAGVDRLREALVPLQGVALAPEVWERDVLPRRVGAYSQAWMDQLCAGGELVWLGAGALGRNSGKVALYFREDVAFLGPPPSKTERPEGEIHEAIRARLERGASFWTDLVADVPVEPVELQNALWDLVWAGEVTNDAFAPLRAPRLTLARADRAAAQRRFGRRRRPAAPQIQGRWSLTAPLFADAPAYGPRTRATAEILLERYGIVTRETVLAEGIPGGFAALYGELVNLETLGTARRGYFVEGLGGAQFALPAAIERLRTMRTDEPAGGLVLAATDPANPYGATLPWPRRESDESGRRPARVPGAYVVTLDAEPVLYVERGGKGLLPLREPDEEWLRPALEALAEAVRRGRVPRLGIERFDGEPVVGSATAELLVELGFRQGPRKLTLSA